MVKLHYETDHFCYQPAATSIIEIFLPVIKVHFKNLHNTFDYWILFIDGNQNFSMKKLLVFLFVYGASIGFLKAQLPPDSSILTGKQAFSLERRGSYLFLKWKAVSTPNSYWKVQASTNGIEFFTIGLVMGEDPGEKNTYLYKRSMATIDKRYRWLRIQQTLDSYIIITSGPKALPKK